MLKSLYTIVFCLIILSCQSEDINNNQQRNPFIPNVGFTINVNTNLTAQYPNLTTPTGTAVITSVGFNGIVIINEGNDNYSAYEITDPNHETSACSVLSVAGGVATCGCEDANKYSIAGGGIPFDDATGRLPLKRYFTEYNEPVIRVFNN